MYFPHAFRKSFLPASATLATTGTTAALTAGQIGCFTPDGVTCLSGSSATAKPFIIAGGSYFSQDKIGPVHGGYKESWKSKMINPKYISRVIKVTAKSPLQNVIQVPVTCGLPCDTTYRLRVDVKGSPALRFLSHNLYRVLDSYTGCCSTSDPTLQKDPIVTLLNWADQINLSPIFNTMVQARVYSLATTLSATGSVTATTTQTTIPMSSTTGVLIGQKAVGTGIPANSFVTTVTSNTSIVIKYPTQDAAPTIGSSVSIKFYSDLYSGAQGTYGYPATSAGGSATVPTYIPGATTESGVGGSLVITNITADTAIGTSSSGALIYTAAADAASFSVDAHIELTAAYIETKFGDCTFTPTDKYDLEPLFIYTAIVDESGDPCSANCFTTTHANTGADTSANLATVIQAPVQANGVGETVLRDLILSNRYLQNAYPDSVRVESLRMREIEVDPMISSINRSSLYDHVMVLHSVPRFNNPTSTFDNDQYLLVFYFPKGTSTTGLTDYLTDAVTAAGGIIPTNSAGGNTFEQY
jgi:hypothetical protein